GHGGRVGLYLLQRLVGFACAGSVAAGEGFLDRLRVGFHGLTRALAGIDNRPKGLADIAIEGDSDPQDYLSHSNLSPLSTARRPWAGGISATHRHRASSTLRVRRLPRDRSRREEGKGASCRAPGVLGRTARSHPLR